MYGANEGRERGKPPYTQIRMTESGTVAAEVLYAPLLQAKEYERIVYEYLPNADVDVAHFLHYVRVLYYMPFISLALAHGTSCVVSLFVPADGKKPEGFRKHLCTAAMVLEGLAYMGPAGIALLFFALFYVDQGTTRLLSIEWATLGGLFFITSPSGAVLRGSSQIMFNTFIALLLWQIGEDSVRLAMLHKMAALFWAIGSTHSALEHKAKSIGFAALFVADVLLIVAQTETQNVPLPSYFRPWDTSYDPMWAPLIALWAIALVAVVPTTIELVRSALKLSTSIAGGTLKAGTGFLGTFRRWTGRGKSTESVSGVYGRVPAGEDY